MSFCWHMDISCKFDIANWISIKAYRRSCVLITSYLNGRFSFRAVLKICQKLFGTPCYLDYSFLAETSSTIAMNWFATFRLFSISCTFLSWNVIRNRHEKCIPVEQTDSSFDQSCLSADRYAATFANYFHKLGHLH